jgi:glycosyltransferase involved in cell wall biosynthesis
MRYAESLAKRGDEVDVLALRRNGQDPIEKVRGVRVFRIQERSINEKAKWNYLFRLTKFFIRSAIFLSWKYLRERYEIVHVHNLPDFLVFAAQIPKLFGAKIILDIHDIVPEFYVNKFGKSKDDLIFKALVLIEKMATSFSDHVIISNDIWRQKLISRSVDEMKCTTILNYPDDSMFFQRPKKEKGDKFIIIYPGTLNWHQGVDIAIRAMAVVCKEAPEVEFHIYGEGRERPHLESLVRELKLNGKVHFKESLPLEEIASVMAQADLGVVPKRNDSFGGEAFSTKILQFMALSVPVIVSETIIDKHYFNDSVVKFFRPEDEKDLAKSMLKMIKDQYFRKNLAENALKFVEDFFWEKRKGEYLDLVDRLISSKTRKS